MCDTYHNLINDLNNTNQSVYAIEMTPIFHDKLVTEMGCDKRLLEINGLPIIFIHGANIDYKFIDIEQYRLRVKHNEILRIYERLYKRLLIIINGGYKIKDAQKIQDTIIVDLKKFVKRLNTIEEQILTKCW